MSSRERRPRRRRRSAPEGLALRALGVAAAFAVGLAVGSALDDNPDAGSTQTFVRTLQPRPLAPAQTTVTTTITVNTG